MSDAKLTKQEVAKGIKEFLKTAEALYLPGISIDPVIFSFHNNKLNVLAVRIAGSPKFGLPGGFVQKDEDIDEAALRTLREMTGIRDVYLEQFYTSGKARRNQAVAKDMLKEMGIRLTADNWMSQRFISICYYALVDAKKIIPEAIPFIEEFKWFDLKKMPKLLYDHNEIVEKAVSCLQSDLDKKLVEFNLLDETFTMKDLQRLYEIIHQRKMVRTNFQRRMLNLGVLERLDKKYNGKSHKAPYLYRFSGKK